MVKPVVLRFLGDTKNLKKATKKANKLLGGVGAAAKKAAKVGTKAAAIAGIAAVKVFADFDEAMNQSIAIMGNVSDAMRGKMEKAARKVGKTTRLSAKEAADSYFFLASAGLDAKQSISALPQVANFAQAGMFDMATATDLATDAQSALGLSVKDPAKNLKNLTRVTDVFTKSNTLANTSVQQIAEAMTSGAGAAAKVVGKDIEETSAVLAALADQGIKGAEAGTQFGIVMRDLQTKALKNKDAFEQAGVAVFDASGEMRHIGDIVGDLEGQLDGMSDAEKKSALLGLGFSDKSVKSLQTLLGSSEAIKEYDKALRDSSGFTKNVAAKQMKSFTAKLGLLKDKVIDVGISIGAKLAPHLIDAMEVAGRFADKVVPALENAFATAGPPIQDVLRKLGNWWKKNGPTVMASIERLGKITGQVFGAISGFIKDVTANFKSSGKDVESSAGKVARIIQGLQSMFASAFAAISAVVKVAVRVITVLWDRFGATIVETVRGFISGVLTAIEGWTQMMAGLFDLIEAIFTGKWGEAWEAIHKIAKGYIKSLTGIIKAGLSLIVGLAKMSFGFFVDVIKSAWNASLRIIRGLSARIRENVANLASGIVRAITFIPGKILDLAGHFANAGAGLMRNLISGFTNAVGDAASAGVTIAKKIANGIIRTINNVIDDINATVQFEFDPPGPGSFTFDPPDVPHIPSFGEGTVVRSPTVALIGEDGDEAIVPLEKPGRRNAIMREAGLTDDEQRGSGGLHLTQYITALDPRKAARESADEWSWAAKTEGV